MILHITTLIMFFTLITYIIIMSIGVFWKNSKFNNFIKKDIAFNIGVSLLITTIILSILTCL